MQALLDFEPSPVLPRLRDGLLATFGPQIARERLDPLSQLIKSLISARTFDAVSATAFANLRKTFGASGATWDALAAAAPDKIEAAIANVTFAEQKARQLPILLGVITHRAGRLDLDFLADQPIEQAMTWLQTLPGVGCHIAAAVLNFSRLNKRAMVVDAHVHRVARRLGLSARTGEPAQSHAALMALAPPAWNAETLLELHWLMKGLGQTICIDGPPLCGRCPLKALCPRVDVGVGRKVIAFTGARKPARRREASGCRLR